MNIGTAVPLPAYNIDPAFMAKKAEDLGFDSIWYAEHPAVPVHSDSPFPATGGAIPWTYSHFTDPYIALARASAVTSRIKLATGITLRLSADSPGNEEGQEGQAADRGLAGLVASLKAG